MTSPMGAVTGATLAVTQLFHTQNILPMLVEWGDSCLLVVYSIGILYLACAASHILESISESLLCHACTWFVRGNINHLCDVWEAFSWQAHAVVLADGSRWE